MTRPSSWLAAIFFLAAVTLGYLYLRQRVEMGLIRAEMAEKSFRAEQDHRQIADYQKKLVAANDAAKKAEEELTAQDRAATSRTQAATAANRNRVINTSDIARDHPEYAELQRKQLRRALLRQYGDAFAALNLPADQLAQLKDLLASRSFGSGDPRLAGLDPGTPAYNQAVRGIIQGTNQQIEALIGPDGQQKLREAQNFNMAKTQIANNYAPDFEEAGVPLTSAQADGLARLLTPGNLIGRGAPDPTTGLTPTDDALFEQAAQVISPAQLAIMKADRADQNRMNAIMSQYLSTTGGGGGTIISNGGTIITNGR